MMRIAALLAVAAAGALANATPLTAQPADDPLRGFCALDKSSAVCEAGQAGQQKRDGLDLGAEIAKGEAWRGTPVTRGEMTTCLASWVAIREAVAGGDNRWPAAVTPAAAQVQIRRWEGFVAKVFKGLEDRLPADRRSAENEARTNVSNARVADVAQWAGFCKREPTFE